MISLGCMHFENDIELDGCNYTIYVDRNEEEETMVADVFMPVRNKSVMSRRGCNHDLHKVMSDCKQTWQKNIV